jgi:hypothetical protein
MSALVLYDTARQRFAQGELDWRLVEVQASLLPTSYVLDVYGHRTKADLGPLLATAEVMGKTVDASGYCSAGTVVFESLTLEEAADQVVLWLGDGDEGLLAHAQFTAVGPYSEAQTLRLLWEATYPGLFRL